MSIAQRLPTDFQMRWRGDHVTVSGTCASAHQLDAIVEALIVMRRALPLNREAVAGDIGVEKPEPQFMDGLNALIGAPTIEGHNDEPVA